MKKYILCVVFAAAVLLSACGGGKYVARVGDEVITEAQFEFYLSSIKQQMQGTELTEDEDWHTKEIEGKKAIEAAKERAYELATENLAYIELVKVEGLELDDNDREEIRQTKAELEDRYEASGGYKEFLKQNNIDDKFIDTFLTAQKCGEKLFEKLRTEQPVTDEEAEGYYEEHKAEYGEGASEYELDDIKEEIYARNFSQYIKQLIEERIDIEKNEEVYAEIGYGE